MAKNKLPTSLSFCPGLNLGVVLQVQVAGVGSSLSSLIGMEEGSFLIIKTPHLSDIGTKLYKKNHITIRYIHAGQVFGFHSTLTAVIKEPFRFCILSYPTTVETLNLRKHERLSCLIEAKIKLLQGIFFGFIEDLSMGGCGFQLHIPPEGQFPYIKIGDEATLNFTLPDTSKKIAISIAVRTIKMDNHMMKIGAQFIKSSPPDIEGTNLKAIGDFIVGF